MRIIKKRKKREKNALIVRKGGDCLVQKKAVEKSGHDNAKNFLFQKLEQLSDAHQP